MATGSDTVEQLANREYKYGFVTDIETQEFPKGLNEDIIRMISAKKNEPEFMLEWRLKAYRHWLTMNEPKWAKLTYPPIDYQDATTMPRQRLPPPDPRAWTRWIPSC